VLEDQVKDFDSRFDGVAVPRPPHWRGYRIVPVDIEFWRDRRSRLHERRLFSRERPDDQWAARMLYP
jgi:pyridoxamine 5'-phosphate oxidase